ncbi:MAG: ABC transporter permease subunit [Eubacteriales bacterium]|nr:ABC transporter permease subunit [Eubacteriales bacterium]
MNVFRFELRRTWVGVAVWTLVMTGLLAGLITGALPAFLESRAGVESMLANFPPAFAAAFGMQMDNLFSFGGLYSFGFLYFSIFGTIMASGLGLNLFSREKREKCMDFLLTKPRARGRLFSEKLLAALTLLVVSNALFIIESLALYRAYAPAPLLIGHALLAASSLLLTELLFLSIGAVIAVLARKIRSVSGLATAIGFAGFLLSALHSLLEEESLRYITPFQYYDTAKAFFNGAFEAKYALIGVALTLGLMAAAYARYTRVDIPAL